MSCVGCGASSQQWQSNWYPPSAMYEQQQVWAFLLTAAKHLYVGNLCVIDKARVWAGSLLMCFYPLSHVYTTSCCWRTVWWSWEMVWLVKCLSCKCECLSLSPGIPVCSLLLWWTSWPKAIWKGKVYFTLNLWNNILSPREVSVGSQAGTWRQEPKQRLQQQRADSSLTCHTVILFYFVLFCFVTDPRPPAQEMELPTVGWVPPISY